MSYRATARGEAFEFADLAALLGKAGEEAAGDQLAGLAADSQRERAAAKIALSEVRLGDFLDAPPLPPDQDEVSRVIFGDLDEKVSQELRSLCVYELRERLLDYATGPEEVSRLGRGLTSEQIAAVAKVMSTLDLVYAASKMRVTSTARTTVGLPGTLSSRIQPNHPADDIEGILASLKEELSYCGGDAIIGINPTYDTAQGVRAIHEAVNAFREHWQIPTQVCVLSHVTTQMEAARQGTSIDIFFQSLAGNDATNAAFGVSAAMLDEVAELAKTASPVEGPNRLYFETGQGSELSLGLHGRLDMVSLESRTYGFCRHWKPFMVNNVTGFIGPETHRDGKQVIRGTLEDHLMGKLHGLPMGMAPCYVAHMLMDDDDRQNAVMLAAMAGAAYYMAIPAGDDVMLSYRDESGHDDQSLRELLGKRPAPEYAVWAERMGFLSPDGRLGPRAGDASVFVEAYHREVFG